MKNFWIVTLCLLSTSALALNLGGLKLPGSNSSSSTSTSSSSGGVAVNTTSSVEESPYQKQPAYNMTPEALADQIDAYVKQKFHGEGGMYKTSLESVIAHMTQKYGPPSNKNNIYAEWILHAQNADCTKMRFSFDGHFTNVTRSVGTCTLID